MFENLLKVIHVLEGPPQAEHWECGTCMGGNQQRWATDSVRTKSWSGDSKIYCVRFWHRILARNMSWQNSFCSFCFQSRRNIVLQVLMTWFKLLPMNQISSRRSKLEMNPGSIATHMIRKWRPSHPKSTRLVLHAQGRHSKSQPDQDHVNCVFWLERCCPSWVCPSGPNN